MLSRRATGPLGPPPPTLANCVDAKHRWNDFKPTHGASQQEESSWATIFNNYAVVAELRSDRHGNPPWPVGNLGMSEKRTKSDKSVRQAEKLEKKARHPGAKKKKRPSRKSIPETRQSKMARIENPPRNGEVSVTSARTSAKPRPGLCERLRRNSLANCCEQAFMLPSSPAL